MERSPEEEEKRRCSREVRVAFDQARYDGAAGDVERLAAAVRGRDLFAVHRERALDRCVSEPVPDLPAAKLSFATKYVNPAMLTWLVIIGVCSLTQTLVLLGALTVVWRRMKAAEARMLADREGLKFAEGIKS